MIVENKIMSQYYNLLALAIDILREIEKVAEPDIPSEDKEDYEEAWSDSDDSRKYTYYMYVYMYSYA